MEKVDLSVLRTLQIQPELIDGMNFLSSILSVDVDVLICDAIKMYLSAMKICTHRIMDAAELGILVKVDKNGN